MKQPKRCRWMSIPDLLHHVLRRSNKFAVRLANKPRPTQLKAIRRLVLRAEQRDDDQFTKRVGREIYVKVDAVDALLPADLESITTLEVKVADVATFAKRISVLQSGQGNKLRLHEKRLATLEQKQALTAKFIREMSELDSAI
jgi:hypothetical protein